MVVSLNGFFCFTVLMLWNVLHIYILHKTHKSNRFDDNTLCIQPVSYRIFLFRFFFQIQFALLWLVIHSSSVIFLCLYFRCITSVFVWYVCTQPKMGNVEKRRVWEKDNNIFHQSVMFLYLFRFFFLLRTFFLSRTFLFSECLMWCARNDANNSFCWYFVSVSSLF